MINGRFGTVTGRPYMESRLYLPRLGVQGDITFLLDTGADCSMLMPGDAVRLNVPFDQLGGESEAIGLGGVAHCFVEPAVLVFTEPGAKQYIYQLELDILPMDAGMLSFTSLLGRDIMDRWRITYDPQNSLLRARVRSADKTINLAAL